MTPQERDLIVTLLQRLKAAAGQPKDPEAESLIRQALTEQPDAPYYLVQTVLIQDLSLGDAQRRIADLERRIEDAKRSQPALSSGTSFLGGALGRGTAGGGGSVPATGPSATKWGAPPPPPYPTQTPTPSPAPPPYPQGGYAQPAMGGAGGFLRSAATTAAGIAGGALLFQGIESMFGHHAAGILGNQAAATPGLGETVVNNFYGDQSGGADTAQAGDPDYFSRDPESQATTADYDPGSDTDAAGTDYASDEDFGDFGGDDTGSDWT